MYNQPPYVIVEEFGAIAAAVKTALALPVLNFQYGYARELNETLQQFAESPLHDTLVTPLLFVEQPFTITRGDSAAFYGTLNTVRIFIIQQTDENYKAAERMANVFKPVIYPIYMEFMKQLDLSVAFHTQAADMVEHTFTDRYFWGEAQKAILNTIIDCSIITLRNLDIANKLNCQPAFSSF